MRQIFRNKRSYRCSILSEWPSTSACHPILSVCSLCSKRRPKKRERPKKGMHTSAYFVQHLNCIVHIILTPLMLSSVLPPQKQRLLVANGAGMRYQRAQLYAVYMCTCTCTYVHVALLSLVPLLCCSYDTYMYVCPAERPHS